MAAPPEAIQWIDEPSLAQLTTLGVGGPARCLAQCTGDAGVRGALEIAAERDLPVYVLGGGSNLLVADGGFDGMVIQVADQVLDSYRGPDDEFLQLRVGAGLEWDDLVAHTVAEGLAGLECLSGIPGWVGAAPVQNVGAYGQQVAETVSHVDVVELATGDSQRLPAAACGFDYRWSRFKGPWRGKYAITAVHFRLRARDQGTVRYPDLQQRLGMAEGKAAPDLATVRAAVLDIRRRKSMVLDDPDDPNQQSAGSFFVNPVVDADTAARVNRIGLERRGAEPPNWPAGRRVKLPAAWLIEAAGFAKGTQRGAAGISTRHALALVNRGGASARDLLNLAAEIRSAVHGVFGVTLEPEPQFLGFDADAGDILDRIHPRREHHATEDSQSTTQP